MPLDPAAVEAAVVQPAERVGLRVEVALINEIRKEMSANPYALPMLGYALQQTWRRRRNGWLTLAGYAESGGIARALQDGAQGAWARLPADAHNTAQRLLLRLSHVDDDGIAVRRRRRVADLVTELDDQITVTATVNSLASARLLTLTEDAAGNAVVEIAHEALLVEWPLLREWLREDRDAARARDELIEAVQRWTEHRHDPGYLLPPGRLAVIAALHDGRRVHLTSEESRFLRESRRRARRARAVRRLLPSLAALLLVVTTVAGYAVVAQRRAVTAQHVSTALEAAASARSVAPTQRDLGMLLAVAAYRAHADPSTLSTLVDSVATTDGPLAYQRPSPTANALAPTLAAGGAAILGLSDGRIEMLPPHPDAAHYLPGRQDAVNVVSTTGDLVASGDISGAVLVQRASGNGATLKFVAGGVGRPVVALALDPQRQLVAAAVGHTVHRFSLTTPNQRFPVLLAPGEISDLASDSADDQIVAATTNGQLPRWRASTGAVLPALADANDSLAATTTPRLSFDERSGLAVVDGSQLYVWPRLADAHPAHTGADAAGALSVTWAPDHTRLLVAAATGAITAWQTDSAPGPTASARAGATARTKADAPPLQLGADYRGLASVSQEGAPGPGLATNGQQLVGLDGSGAVLRWQLDEAVSPALQTVSELPANARAVAWSTGNQIAAGSLDGRVTVVDPDGRRERVSQVPAPVAALLWRTRTELVVGAGDGAVYDLLAGAPARRVTALSSSPIVAMAAASPGRTAVLHDSGELQVIDSRGSVLLRRQFPRSANAMAISASGLIAVATGDRHQSVITLERMNGSHVHTLRGHALQVDSLAFSPDDTQLASGSDDRTIRLWSTSSAALQRILRGHTDMVTGLVYSADGALLGSSSQDGTARLWSTKTGTEIGAPLVDVSGHYVQSIAVSADGSRLVAGNGIAVDVWPFTPRGWSRTACALADRDLSAPEWAAYAPGLAPRSLCAT